MAAALDLLIALEAPQRADARAVRSDFLSVPLLESSRARLVVRRLAERRNAKEADDDAGGEGGGAAPEVTPRRLHCDVNSTQNSQIWGGYCAASSVASTKLEKTRFGLAARRGPAPKKSSVGGWRRLARRVKTVYLAKLAGKDELQKKPKRELAECKALANQNSHY